jgi:peptidoglycan lytic transglycosylase G
MKATRRPTGAGGRWRRRFAAAIAIAALAAALWFINSTFQPFHGSGSGGVAVVVPKGADAGQIGDLLERAGVIDSSFFFQVNATVTLRRGDLLDGHYLLRKGMTNGEAIDALMQGPKAKVVKTYTVTIPEGISRHEAAPAIRKAGVEGDYLKASNRQAARRQARKLGMPKGTKTLEGFLFPATYTLTAGATANTLVDKQLDAFKDSFAKLDMRSAKRRNLTRYDVLIIASMIEREASLDRERPLIAAVIYNRLKRGMPLGIDATIRYAENNWTRPLRVSELERDGPYNTRLRRGLPPTPIGNPGLASLRAAAHPGSQSYLFYVRKPGKSGEHAFSSTDAQFERDVKRYQASRKNK